MGSTERLDGSMEEGAEAKRPGVVVDRADTR
jgi:hypothetical protein